VVLLLLLGWHVSGVVLVLNGLLLPKAARIADFTHPQTVLQN